MELNNKQSAGVNMIKLIIMFGLLLVVTSCSSISFTSDYDPATDFSGYKTFAVHEGTVDGSELENAPLIKRRVIDAIRKVMVSKGFLLTEENNADIIVYPFAGTNDKIKVTDWGYNYGPYWRRYPNGRNIDVTSYTEATLVLDLVDSKSDQLIWRGAGTGAIRENNSPEERTEAIDNAVSRILENYPPTN